MAIYRLLKDTEFGAEDIEAMTTAFHAALKTLSVADSMSPTAIFIAKNIVDVARRGERDPARLYEKGLGSCKPSVRTTPLGPPKPLDQTKTPAPTKAVRQEKPLGQTKAKTRTKALSRTKTLDRRKT